MSPSQKWDEKSHFGEFDLRKRYKYVAKGEKPHFFEEGEKKNGKGFEKKRLLAYQIPYMKSQGICRKHGYGL